MIVLAEKNLLDYRKIECIDAGTVNTKFARDCDRVR